MKKIVCLCLALVLVLSLVACGKESAAFDPTITTYGENANIAFPLSKADAASLRTMLDKVTWEALCDADPAKADAAIYLDNENDSVEILLDEGLMIRTATNEQAALPAAMDDLVRAIIGESRVESMTALCETAVAMLPEDVVLFKVSEEEVMNAIPGLADIDCEELCAYFPAVYGYGCEVVMVAVDAEDVAATEQIFRDYVDSMANDTDYPDNAEGWKNNAIVSVKGNVVTLCCLPDGVDAPDILLGI